MDRTSWVYCPKCRRDLNGDNESFVDDCGSLTSYTCATCGFNSEFLLEAPAPIYVGEWACSCSEPDYQDEHCSIHGRALVIVGAEARAGIMTAERVIADVLRDTFSRSPIHRVLSDQWVQLGPNTLDVLRLASDIANALDARRLDSGR